MSFRFPALPWVGRWGGGLLLLLSIASASRAQSPAACSLSLSGRVADHESQADLPGATVVVLETQQATQADAAGNFHFHLCAGLYHIQVTFLGYQSETAELRVERALVRNFRLHPDAVRLRSATVQATRIPAPTLQPTAMLSGQALQQTRGQALGEALQRIAGVTAIQTGPSIFKPMIHGLHSNRLTILNNGVRQEGQQWGQEHGPEIDPFIASRLTVVKGAASVRYGSDAIGGVILVEPKPLRDSVGTAAELSLVSMSNNGLGAASATVEGNLRRLPALSWRVQGTAKRAGTMRAPGYYLKNSSFQEYNFSVAAGWRKDAYGLDAFYSQYNTRIGILPAAHVGNPTDLVLAIARNRPLETSSFSYDLERAYQRVRHNVARLTGFWQTGEAGRLTATMAQQIDFRDEYDKYRPRNDNLASLNKPALSYTNRTSTGEVLWEHRRWHNLTGSVGVAGTYQFNRYAAGSRQFIPFYTNTSGGAYWLEKWQRTKWELEAGLRLDRRDLQVKRGDRDSTGAYFVERRRFQYTTPAAALGASFYPSPHLTLSLTTGLTRRAPAANERFSDGVHNAQYELGYDLVPGNGPLLPESALHVGLTTTWHDNPRLNGEITVYQTRITDFIYQVPVLPPVITIRGALISWQYQQTDATFRGVDVAASYQLGPRWLLAAKGSLVRARDTRQDQWQIFMPADRAEASLRYDFAPRPAARLTHCYVQLGGYAVAPQTRVPDQYAEKDYKLPPAGYALLGLEAGATMHWGQVPLEVSLAGANLLNQRYRDYLNRYRYFADEMGRNVTLRVRVPLELTRQERPVN